jgi:hypothetical protein
MSNTEFTSSQPDPGSPTFSENGSNVETVQWEYTDDLLHPESLMHTVSFRPLTDFLKSHIHYLATGTLHPDYECRICLHHHSESRERFLQVDLPHCHHIYGADCFEIHIQHSSTCPMCRAMWFEERRTGTEPEAENLLLIMTPDDIQRLHSHSHIHAGGGGGRIQIVLQLGEDMTGSGESSQNTLVDVEEGEDGGSRESAIVIEDSSDTGGNSNEEGQPPRRRRRLE